MLAPASPAAPPDALTGLEGVWGIEMFDDMSCAANPMHIALAADRTSLILTWVDAVSYSDGGVRERETFSVLSVAGRRVDVRRSRDGVLAYFVLADDGMSYEFDLTQHDGSAGSTAVRCAASSS
ncbi:hypothetical protein LHP98_17355 [Rhodobacter sp. Har01]|uniref:hypothetical protein n=1 Tax=Rhodobacter sp. Har01 TaxID=2883999 RepID=UPI001D08784C|nr:hypothetical protein [Rhodobacter sp. Har01]MCB6179892.1 hypothetical protein [Rhodobacter sp. Har01]